MIFFVPRPAILGLITANVQLKRVSGQRLSTQQSKPKLETLMSRRATCFVPKGQMIGKKSGFSQTPSSSMRIFQRAWRIQVLELNRFGCIPKERRGYGRVTKPYFN